MNALTGQGYFAQPNPQQPQPMPAPQPMPQPQNFQPYQQQPTFQPSPGFNPQPFQPQTQMPQMPQPQVMPQPQQVPIGFTGRYVNSIDEVVLNEIPMDGSIAIFPTKDAQAIYLKVWNQNGSLLTARYVLDPVQPEQQATKAAPMDDILDRLNKLEAAISKRTKKVENKEAN